jgi:hypothetical protein
MRNQSRREFVCRTIPAALAAGSALALGPFRSALAAQFPAATRSYTASRFALEIDGQFAGWLQTAAGGNPVTDVVAGSATAIGVQKSHVVAPKYQDIVLTCGTGMSRGFYDWIGASLANHVVPRNGSLVSCDFNNKAVSQMDWFNSFISQIVFPACDGASRAPGSIMVKVTPAETRWMQANGAAALPGAPSASAKNVLWFPANFRLNITGLDCSGVNRIEAIAAATAPNQNVNPVMTALAGAASSMQIPNLVVTFPETQAAGFAKWRQDSAVQSNASSNPVRAGVLQYLAAGTGGHRRATFFAFVPRTCLATIGPSNCFRWPSTNAQREGRHDLQRSSLRL